MAKVSSIVCLVFTVSIAVSGAHKLQPRIINGKSASFGLFPFFSWLKFPLEEQKMSFCGGSLISSEFILTAAHCTIVSDYVEIFLGYWNFKNLNETQHFIVHEEHFYAHPEFEQNENIHDISLIRLPQAVIFTPTIQPIKLSRRTFSNQGRTDIFAIGTGSPQLNTNGMSSILKYIRLKTLTIEMCTDIYPFLEGRDDVFCAESIKTGSTYRGDSGGATIRRDDGTLFGILSFANTHRDGVLPQAFTFIPFHFEWISNVTGMKLPKNVPLKIR